MFNDDVIQEVCGLYCTCNYIYMPIMPIINVPSEQALISFLRWTEIIKRVSTETFTEPTHRCHVPKLPYI